MRHPHTERLKQIIRPLLFRLFARGRAQYACPICGYTGPFKDKRISREPDLVRVSSKCPGCASTERHRMMHLVFKELFDGFDGTGKRVLHIAPEACLKDELTERFATYHTSDLLKKDVDFNEDIQAMGFDDGSYDCVVVSRVLTIPPDLEASIREVRRVLRPGGFAIIAEVFKHQQIQEFGRMINGRSREIGVEMLDRLEAHFERVDCYLSDRYDQSYQLSNRMALDGQTHDAFPERVRIPGVGFMELVAVCHA